MLVWISAERNPAVLRETRLGLLVVSKTSPSYRRNSAPDGAACVSDAHTRWTSTARKATDADFEVYDPWPRSQIRPDHTFAKSTASAGQGSSRSEDGAGAKSIRASLAKTVQAISFTLVGPIQGWRFYPVVMVSHAFCRSRCGTLNPNIDFTGQGAG